MDKEYVLGWAPERMFINVEKELNKEYVLGRKKAPERIFIKTRICAGGGGAKNTCNEIWGVKIDYPPIQRVDTS